MTAGVCRSRGVDGKPVVDGHHLIFRNSVVDEELSGLAHGRAGHCWTLDVLLIQSKAIGK